MGGTDSPLSWFLFASDEELAQLTHPTDIIKAARGL
jgi:hypothetical protein